MKFIELKLESKNKGVTNLCINVKSLKSLLVGNENSMQIEFEEFKTFYGKATIFDFERFISFLEDKEEITFPIFLDVEEFDKF